MRDVINAAAVLRPVARAFDAALLTGADCETVVREAAAIEAMAATVKALAAARVAACKVHEATSAASAEQHLARLTGTTPAQAREQIATGRSLALLGETATRARNGDLSAQQTALIAGAATANPNAERELLEAATTSTLGQLRDRAANVRAAADPDPDATHARLVKQRCGRRYTAGDGAAVLHLQTTPEAMAEIDVTLTPIVDELFHAARREGRRECREAYVADAMVEMARRARGVSSGTRKTPPTYTAVIRADLTALVRGTVEGDEVVEISGIGPIPASTARSLLGESVLKLVLTKGVEVRNVTSLGRGPTAAMKIAMLWEQPECGALFCGRRARLEFDHRKPFADDQVTELDNGDHLCDDHHDKKTYEGWALVEGRGIRPMVPPDDPRHPRNAHAPPRTG